MWSLWMIGLVAGVAGLCVAIGTFILTFVYQGRKIKRLKTTMMQYANRNANTNAENIDVEAEAAAEGQQRQDTARVDEEQQPDLESNGRGSFQHDFCMPVSKENPDDSDDLIAAYQDQNATPEKHQHQQQQQQQENERPLVMRNNTFIRPFRQLSSHTSGKKRNKLRRGIPLKSISLSPLSAITEKSMSPGPSPRQTIPSPLSVKNDRRRSSDTIPKAVPWPLGIGKTRKAMRTDHSDTSQKGLVTILPQLSEDSVVTDVANVSPTIKTINIRCDDPDKQRLLKRLSVSPERQFQIFREFDFGLSPHSARSTSNPDRTSVKVPTFQYTLDAMDVELNLSDDKDSSALTWSDHTAEQRARSSMTGPPGRHSMYVGDKTLRSSSLATVQTDRLEVPSSNSSPRPSSVSYTDTHLLRKDSASSRKTSQSQTRHHRRQNCVRISGIPMASQAANRNKGRVGSVDASDTSRLPRISFTRLEADQAYPWPRPLVLRRPRPLSSTKRRDSEVFNDSNPETPLSKSYIAEEEDEDIPLQQLSSPGPAYDSPILPSPAYTSAGLFPRRPYLHGPRGFHSSLSSPTTRSYPKRQRLSTDLRRSIMMLRSMNSEETLLNKDWNRAYHSLGGECSSNQSQRSSLNSHEPSNTPSQSSSRPSTPNTNIAVSHSAVSIWEDASIRGDSPEPDMPALSDLHHLLDTQPPNRRCSSKRTSLLKDKENHQPLVLLTAEIGGTPVKFGHTPRKAGIEAEQRAWGTPGSLYDELGFLKE